jgi:hypothetical protein
MAAEYSNTVGKVWVADDRRTPEVVACEQAYARVKRFTIKKSRYGEADLSAPNVTATDVAEILAESKGGCIMHRFKEFASEFKWLMVALKDAHYQHLPNEMAKRRVGVSKTRAQQQRTSRAKELALEQVFNQCLSNIGGTTLTHADLVEKKVCDEFEVW